MFRSLKINSFRMFADKEIYLGRYVTALAGRNSTGKSTVLGMLGNSSELKKKEGATYTDGRFRAEFSELFKGSKQFDASGSNLFEINVTDADGNVVETCSFRTSWQKYDNAEIEAMRFRIIPSRILGDGKQTAAKMEYPVLYLGLSRLFPIGESHDETIANSKVHFASEAHRQWFMEKYTHILSLQDDVSDVSQVSIGETDKKHGIGITTEKYDYLTNSAGQDNIGQILMAILSFKKLKENMGDAWRGGLLLIDEIEATLHPSAQNRLLEILIQETRSVGFQVVFTTHSLSLLKNICQKTTHNNDRLNGIELYYFSNANRHLEIKRNSDYFAIESDLLVQSIVQNNRKIRVYSEDDENRWMLKQLVSNYLPFLDVLEANVGCVELMSLYRADTSYFGNSLIVLDGDVPDKTIQTVPEALRNHFKNIVKLPGKARPEEVIYSYLISLPEDHDFWSAIGGGLTWIYFKENGPQSAEYSQEKDREKYKAWFKKHQELFDIYHLMDYWIRDNNELVQTFLVEFRKAYNAVAQRMMVPLITE